MKIEATYLFPPSEATDAHVDVMVAVTNDGPTAVTGDLAPVAPLAFPYWSDRFEHGHLTVEPGETVTTQVRVHMSTGPIAAPKTPEFTFVTSA